MTNEKVIHIFDDLKFIDSAIKLIESVYPNSSKYFVIQNVKEPFNYVKSDKAEPLLLQNKEDENKFVNYINESKTEVVFFHALNLVKQRLVNNIDNKVVKVWFIWGYDFYLNWQPLSRYLYESDTLLFLNKKITETSFKHKLIYNKFSFWLFHTFKDKNFLLPKKVNNILGNAYVTEFYKAVQKIDIVVPIVPNEYELVKGLKISPLYAPFNYGCIEDLLNDKIYDTVLDSKNILIGNSGDPSNNHITIFKRISKINLNERKIIVPLSYGGTKEYVDYIIEKGNYYFGENFVPLINFMSLKDYNQLISSCGFVIFNHIRQQAVGNIITMGYMGAKVFLNEKSPVYEYYKSLGINVYGINEINEVQLNKNLNADEFQNNKRLFFDIYSNNAVKNKIKELYKIVNLVLKRNN